MNHPSTPSASPYRARQLAEDARAAELLRTEAEASRVRWRDVLRTCAECFAWCLCGLYLLGWAMHTTDPGWGRIAFYGGLVIGNGGILASLYLAHQRAVRRGDHI